MATAKKATEAKAEVEESKPRESRLERLQRELAEEQVKEAERLTKVRASKVEALERANANIEKWTKIKERITNEIDRIDTVVNNSTAVDYALALSPVEDQVQAKLDGIAGTQEEFVEETDDNDDEA